MNIASDHVSTGDPRAQLPPQLYRGDCDPARTRSLHATLGSGHLVTNLGGGGSGREIFSAPLIAMVERHVRSEWEKTHFLSFSASQDRALVFAAGLDRTPLDLEVADDRQWDAALITLDTSQFHTIIPTGHGIYRCAYPGLLPVRADSRLRRQPLAPIRIDELYRAAAFPERGRPPVTVVLVDVVSYLEAHAADGHQVDIDALQNARRDHEWLVLPVDPCDVPGEFTALLDDACIGQFERYRFRR